MYTQNISPFHTFSGYPYYTSPCAVHRLQEPPESVAAAGREGVARAVELVAGSLRAEDEANPLPSFIRFAKLKALVPGYIINSPHKGMAQQPVVSL